MSAFSLLPVKPDPDEAADRDHARRTKAAYDAALETLMLAAQKFHFDCLYADIPLERGADGFCEIIAEMAGDHVTSAHGAMWRELL